MGLVLTWMYAVLTEPAVNASNLSAPLGFITETEGQHRVRREDSKIWTGLQEGDLLFEKDVIRTGETGQISIQLLQNDQRLEIESDSVLKLDFLDDTKTSVTLEVTEGNLTLSNPSKAIFSLASPEEKSAPTIISDPQAFISKQVGEKLQIQASSTVVVDNSFGVSWQSPKGDFLHKVNPSHSIDPVFSWKAELPSPEMVLALEYGPSRKKTDQRFALSKCCEMGVPVPFGKNYWRWSIYKDQQTFEQGQALFRSPTAKGVIAPLFPPITQSPTLGEQLQIQKLQDTIKFRWSTQTRFTEYILKVFAMEKVLHEAKTTLDQSSWAVTQFGDLSWSISGFDKDEKRWLESERISFRVVQRFNEKLNLQWTSIPIELNSYVTIEPSALLRWQIDKAQFVSQYKLFIAPVGKILDLSSPVELPATSQQYRVNLKESLPHQARIRAYNKDGLMIAESSVIEFHPRPLPLLRAPAFTGNTKLLKATESGQAVVLWSNLEGANNYQVEVRKPQGQTELLQTNQNQFEFSGLDPGAYSVKVWGVDQFGRPGYSSDPVSIVVPPRAPLPAVRIKSVEVDGR